MSIIIQVGTRLEVDDRTVEVVDNVTGCLGCVFLGDKRCNMFDCGSKAIFKALIERKTLSTAEAIKRFIADSEVYSKHCEKGHGTVDALMESLEDILSAHDQGDTFFREVSLR